jgi:SAM-dependent methyltransferase
MVSLGGALGGVFVGLLSPVLFNNYLELPIGLLVTVILIGIVLHRAAPSLPGPTARWVEYGLVTALAGGLIYLLAWENPHFYSMYRLIKRNFYGVVRVEDSDETGETEPMRTLLHGTISHGSEYLRTPFHRRPTTYYGKLSGVGVALADGAGVPPRRVAVIGLGAGTISSYARPGDFYRFYEINPEVVNIARREFFYLKECPAKWEVALGDARLSLEREPPQAFDVIAVDAFSGDSIPVHLLTIEAIREYFRHLAPDGVLTIHVSNKFLKLGGVVSRAAKELGKSAILIINEDDNLEATYAADWIVLVNNPEVLKHKRWDVGNRFPVPEPSDLWTDDYSNLVRILK